MYTQYTSIFKTFNYVDYRPDYSPIIAVFFFNHQQTFRTTECDDVQYPKQAKKMDFSKNKWTPPLSSRLTVILLCMYPYPYSVACLLHNGTFYLSKNARDINHLLFKS